ncbi:MAG: hypothetical protein H6831_05675 [Planctomycetes bacterium]|nr:hypothetical protein [Planctomycetota bacterium]MCB9903879.1 hypothetical protein [Planctomycetota bacterium]
MACFQLRRRFAARILRHFASIAAVVALGPGVADVAFSAMQAPSTDLSIDECCLLIEHNGCGQSLLRSDGSRLAIEPFLDYPELTWLQVTGTITGFACDNPCVPVSYMCVELEDVRLCDQGSNYCFGDGLSGWCPCANMTVEGRGCMNTTGQGARFRTGGFPEVGRFIDIYVDGMPPGAPSVLVTGTLMDPLSFHDGLLCIGPPYRRLATLTADVDGCFDTSVVLSALSGAQVGDTKYYQLWYADDALSTCGLGSNFTNAVQLDWMWAPPQ